MKEGSSTSRSVAIGVAILVIAEILMRWGLSSSSIDVLKWMWSAAVRHYSVRGWMIALVGVGPLFVAYVMLKLGGTTSVIQLHQEDHLYGMKWRWALSNDGTIYRLACFCPACDNELIDVKMNHRIYGHPPSFTFSCDRCKEEVGVVETVGSEEPLDRVKREIRRRYRTGEFKQLPNEDKEDVS